MIHVMSRIELCYQQIYKINDFSRWPCENWKICKINDFSWWRCESYKIYKIIIKILRDGLATQAHYTCNIRNIPRFLIHKSQLILQHLSKFTVNDFGTANRGSSTFTCTLSRRVSSGGEERREAAVFAGYCISEVRLINVWFREQF